MRRSVSGVLKSQVGKHSNDSRTVLAERKGRSVARKPCVRIESRGLKGNSTVMGSELPKNRWREEDNRPSWVKDPSLTKGRAILVPDTMEWSGRRPDGEPRRWKPVEIPSPNGWVVRLPVRDLRRGRLLSTSTCSGLETPIMPLRDHAWAWLEIAEAAALVATEEVDAFLMKQGHFLLLPDHIGVQLPYPDYGEWPGPL